MNNNTFYETLGRLFSRTRTRKTAELISSAGMSMGAEAFLGFLLTIDALITILLFIIFSSIPLLRNEILKLSAFLIPSLTASSLLVPALLTFIISVCLTSLLVFLLSYTVLIMLAEERKKQVESVLPDFLLLASSNVRAGMAIDSALWHAAKPEFGLLSREVENVSRQAFAGTPFPKALDMLSMRFDSKALRRSISLIKQGIASGGEMAQILERTAEDSRAMQILAKEIYASLLMYVIFIVFAAAIGTPFLFAVSTKLISILEGVFASMPVISSAAGAGFIHPVSPSISSSEFYLFTLASATITAVFASLIIGAIQYGSKKQGIKYIPLILGASIAIFLLISALLDAYVSV
ncbi:Type II secretion system (T2SS), protein F [Candidatus Anstonella stagnisolia]|nr:Type II secretion system (T2SS), protein F [Candidatus Anstonella stagnisolia]